MQELETLKILEECDEKLENLKNLLTNMDEHWQQCMKILTKIKETHEV